LKWSDEMSFFHLASATGGLWRVSYRVRIPSVNEKEVLPPEEKQIARIEKANERSSQERRGEMPGTGGIRISTGRVPIWSAVSLPAQEWSMRVLVSLAFAPVSTLSRLVMLLQLIMPDML
jgi:hypothetical protein